jgi:RecA-family ATPase
MSGLQMATPETIKDLFRTQPLPAFLQLILPPKEPLIKGLLYKRDIVAMLARRRHGKTTFASQMAIALASGEPRLLGYEIPQKRNVVFYYLDDDPTEVQIKLARQLNGAAPPQGFHLYSRRDLMMLGVQVDASNLTFKMHVELACQRAEADVLFLDNLGHLIGADYNNAAKVHELVQMIFLLQERLNLAVVIAAHPRKVNGKQIVPVNLLNSSEQFFEECMGSSHFIN